MSIIANLGLHGSRARGGGGLLYIAPFNAAKKPVQPHATMSVAIAADGTTLTCYRAPAADTHVPVSFGAAGALDLDVFGTPILNKAYSALTANAFTIAAPGAARAAGCVVKLLSADDYAAADWLPIGYLGGTVFVDSVPSEDIKDEQGLIINTRPGDRTNEFRISLAQSGKDELDFLAKEAPGQYYAAKYVVDCGADGHQIIIAPKVTFVRNIEANYNEQTRTLPAVAKILENGIYAEPYYCYEG